MTTAQSMADEIEAQVIQPQDDIQRDINLPDDHSNTNNYQVYRRRWMVLAAVFSITFVNGIQKSFLPIVDILIKQLDISYDTFRYMSQIPIFVSLITVVPLSKALQHYGLRKMSHLYCILILIAHSIKAACSFVDDPVIGISKPYRFQMFALAEVLVGLSIAMTTVFPAKVAYDWFPVKQTTRALMLGHVGFSLAAGLVNLLIPMIVRDFGDLSKVGYMFEISAISVSLIVFSSIKESRPPTPPSSRAVISEGNIVTLKDGYSVLLTNPFFIMLLAEFSLNVSATSSIQIVLEDILRRNGYSDTFCGLVLAQVFIFGIIFALLSATWIDKSSNYATISRMSSLLVALGFTTFCISLNFSDIRAVILVANTMTTFGSSILVPSLIQVTFKSASGILPEANVSAILVLTSQAMTTFLIYLEGPLKSAAPSKSKNQYSVLLATFSAMILLINFVFAIKFREPDRDKMQQRLTTRVPEILTESTE